ncbi:MAG: DMT family transporter [Bacilli bacterium]
MEKKKSQINRFEQGFIFAIASAIFFSLNVPISKILLNDVSPYWLASLLYFGAGIGTFFYHQSIKLKTPNIRKVKNQTLWYGLMIALDIFAPIFFLIGVKEINGSLVGLLSNAELIFTLMIALIFFKERLSKFSSIASLLIVIGLVIANYQGVSTRFEIGSLWIIVGTLFWGLENNVSKKLSFGNPLFVVIFKGIGTGIGTLIIALILNEVAPTVIYLIFSLISGFFIYGLSLIFYVNAQRSQGAAKVQLIQSFAPILGGILSWIFFQEILSITTIFGYILVIIALVLLGIDSRKGQPH